MTRWLQSCIDRRQARSALALAYLGTPDGIIGAVQILMPFIIAQRYASGVWCAPDPGNALFIYSLEVFVLASILAGELRVLAAVRSRGTSLRNPG